MNYSFIKVYLHLEDSSLKFTHVVRVKDDSLVSDILDNFLMTLREKRIFDCHQINIENLKLSNRDGKNLKPNSELRWDVSDKDDLFVSIIEMKESHIRNSQNEGFAQLSNSVISQNSCVQLKAQAKEMFESKLYKRAKMLCENEILRQNALDFETLELLTLIHIRTRNYESAVATGEKLLNNSTKNPRFYNLLAQAYYGNSEYGEALRCYRKSIEILGGITACASSDRSLLLEDIAGVAEVLFSIGRHTDAAEEINQIMGLPYVEDNVSILIAYSSFAIQYCRTEEALRALLKAVVIQQDNKRVKALLGKLLNTEGAVEELRRQIPPSFESVAAYAFLAIIAKDASALDASVALFRDTLPSSPTNVSVALNLIHVLEAKNDLECAMQELESFFSRSGARTDSIGRCSTQLLGALSADGTDTVSSLVWTPADVHGSGYIECVLESGTKLCPQPQPQPQQMYGEEMLDFLAIGFTAVKILYLLGAFQRLLRLFLVLEPLRLASKKPLHETIIRNENAYYMCIGQLLCVRCEQGGGLAPTHLSSTFRPLFVCGDSHTLSLSWQTIFSSEEESGSSHPLLLVPRLVTGMKHWHLREESEFYPKANFYNCMDSIPPGSNVIFVFGEIDCREGLLLAVERAKYRDIYEGMEHTAGIFTNVLKKLIAQKNIRAFVHPVMPVLKETRPIVTAYNEIYRRKIEAINGAHWLDFLPHLLDEKGGIAEEFQLDGTHVHPKYVKYLEKALRVRISP